DVAEIRVDSAPIIGDRFGLHVAVLQLPFVVGLQQHGADESDDGRSRNVADFEWRVLLRRERLKVSYAAPLANSVPSKRSSVPGFCVPPVSAGTRLATNFVSPSAVISRFRSRSASGSSNASSNTLVNAPCSHSGRS